MKFLFSFIIIILMTVECHKTKDSVSVNSEANIKETSEVKQLQENIILEYTATSRGFYNYVVITSSTVLVQKERNSEPISKSCSKEEWAKIIELLKTIDVGNLSKLEAPSKAHQYDGAAIAQLKILVDDENYETVSFDHGYPPKEIEVLVKEILSISENID